MPSFTKRSLVDPIELLTPLDESTSSVFTALEQRRTIREISDEQLPLQKLSNILWAACGINRKDGPFEMFGITAASASNSQEIEVYATMKEGTFFYDARRNQLQPIIDEDLRVSALTHGQKGVNANAPAQLIYVANIHRLTHTEGFQEPGLHDPEVQKSYYFVDTGIMAGNVYLFCASQGLAAWFHNCDKNIISQKLSLDSDRRVLFSQSIGYPA